MLTIDQLKGLEAGDTIEAGTLFAGMAREPLKLTVFAVAQDHDGVEVLVVGRYFGIFIGEWRITVDGVKSIWTLMPRIDSISDIKPQESVA